MKTRIFKAHGYMGITNNYGAWLEIGKDNETARLALDGGNGLKVCRWQKLKPTKDDAYLTHHGRRYKINDFIGLDKEKAINY